MFIVRYHRGHLKELIYNPIEDMREDFSTMPLSKLVDLLAQETEKFTHLLTYKQYGKQYEASKKRIHAITTAINEQKNNTARKPPLNNPDPSS